MKVVYNANVLIPPLAGIATYSRQLSDEMCSLEGVETVRYFLGSSCGDLGRISELVASATVDTPHKLPLHKKIIRLLLLRYSLGQVLNGIHYYAPALNGPVTAALENLEARGRNREVGDFLYHETNFVLKPHKGPRVATIHDLSIFHYPDFHPKPRVNYMTGGISRSVEHADQIITGSEYIRKELLERYRLDERRVTATPYAADASYCPRGEPDCRDVLAKYGLRYKHFLLVVGSVEPRKNLSLLMDAYGDLPEDVKTNYPLVHVGPAGWNNSEIKPKTDALAAVGWFRSLGYVPQDDLPAIFSAAAGLAFPSIYEGFGLPPLEAMSSGIPLLAGNASSIPELVGDCGILVDPHSREALSRGLAKLLGGGLEIEHMVEAGLQRAKNFSWRRTAECTFDVYTKAQAGRG